MFAGRARIEHIALEGIDEFVSLGEGVIFRGASRVRGADLCHVVGAVPEVVAQVGTATGGKTTFTDRSGDPAVATYFYQIIAVNSLGSISGCIGQV